MPTQKETNPFCYSDTNQRYHTFAYEMKRRFGKRIVKLPIDGGFSCPNRDGTCGREGCAYCSPRGSGDFCSDSLLPIGKQLERQKEILSKKWQGAGYLAYFQAFTNTYAPVDILRKKYEEALSFPDAVGLDIATRADCLPDDVVSYLAELSERTFLTVELGLQTVHDETAARIGRGHGYETFLRGYERLRAASPKISIGIHLIDGLPGEDEDMMLESAREVGRLKPDLLKIHLLHVLKGTRLAEDYEAGKFSCLSQEEYVKTVVKQLEWIPPETVIGRLTGDGAAEDLIAPLWSRRKKEVLNAIDKRFYADNTFQGRKYGDRL